MPINWVLQENDPLVKRCKEALDPKKKTSLPCRVCPEGNLYLLKDRRTVVKRVELDKAKITVAKHKARMAHVQRRKYNLRASTLKATKRSVGPAWARAVERQIRSGEWYATSEDWETLKTLKELSWGEEEEEEDDEEDERMVDAADLEPELQQDEEDQDDDQVLGVSARSGENNKNLSVALEHPEGKLKGVEQNIEALALVTSSSKPLSTTRELHQATLSPDNDKPPQKQAARKSRSKKKLKAKVKELEVQIQRDEQEAQRFAPVVSSSRLSPVSELYELRLPPVTSSKASPVSELCGATLPPPPAPVPGSTNHKLKKKLKAKVRELEVQIQRDKEEAQKFAPVVSSSKASSPVSELYGVTPLPAPANDKLSQEQAARKSERRKKVMTLVAEQEAKLKAKHKRGFTPEERAQHFEVAQHMITPGTPLSPPSSPTAPPTARKLDL